MLTEAEGGERNAFGWQGCHVMYPASGVGGKAEVAGNDRQRNREIALIGFDDGGKGVVMVGAPF